MNARSMENQSTQALNAMKRAVAEVMADRRRRGVPVSIWRDGKVVQVSASKIKPHRPKRRKPAPKRKSR